MLERGIASRILFPAPRPSYTADSFPRELIWVPKRGSLAINEDWGPATSATGGDVPCLLLTYPSARFLIIYFHSNAEDLGWCRGFCCYLREQFQVHVLAVEYPGYGICPGIPCGKTVMENALAAFSFARADLHWPLDSIKVFGRSIGTGPAMGLASLFDVAGLILVTPFLSVQELFRERIGPLARLIEEWFANKDIAPKIKSPTMIIHGQRDDIISCRHGESLFSLISTRKLFVSPPDMEHNTNLLANLQFFVLPMFQFFALPDYVFQDMVVPEWAYQSRRAGPGFAAASAGGALLQDGGRVLHGPGHQGAIGDTIPDLGDGFPPDASSETQDAIRKLEEFAETLCANEISSDGLCALQDLPPASDEELCRQEMALQEIIAARQQQLSPRRPHHAQAPVSPRFVCFGQPESASDFETMWEQWCSKDVRLADDTHSEEPGLMTSMRSVAPRPRRPQHPAMDRGLRRHRAADGPQRQPQHGQATGWARWCGPNTRIGPAVDLYEADTNDIECVRHRMRCRTASGQAPGAGWVQTAPSRGPIAPLHAPCKPPFPELVAQPVPPPVDLMGTQRQPTGCDAFTSKLHPLPGGTSATSTVMVSCCYALPGEDASGSELQGSFAHASNDEAADVRPCQDHSADLSLLGQQISI